MHTKFTASMILGTSLILSAVSAYAETVVIVSANSPIGTLSAHQVSEIFLGRTAALSNGIPVIPIDQAEGSAVRNEFHSQITHKSPSLLKAYWSKSIFTGRAQPPREAADDVAVKALVANNPNLIGYIDHRAVDSRVKVVLTLDK